MSNYLDQINHTGDIKQIPQKAYPELAEEIKKRMFVFEDIVMLDDRDSNKNLQEL